jgi:hypothetical protein
MIKNPTIKDFAAINYIPYKQIEEILGKRRYKKFLKWMCGQTVPADYCPACKNLISIGVYPCDLEWFLKGYNTLD